MNLTIEQAQDALARAQVHENQAEARSNAAHKTEETAWKKIEKKQVVQGDKYEAWVLAQEEASRSAATHMRAYDAVRTAERNLQAIKNPTIRQERVEVMPTNKKVDNSMVPEIYMGINGKMKAGFDAKLKSDLVNCALGDVGLLWQFTVEEALQILEARNWIYALDKRKEVLSRPNKKREKREKKIRQRVADRADGIDPNPREVTPDPKPVRKVRSDKGQRRVRA